MKKIVILTFLLLLPLIIGNNAMAQTRSVTVDGFCYLAGMSDHSGTKVLFYMLLVLPLLQIAPLQMKMAHLL